MSRLLPTLLSITAALALTACSEMSDTSTPSASAHLPTVDVTTLTVTARSEAQIRHLSGSVQAVARATTSAKVMGTITSTRLALGQTVTAGEILVTIAADELSAAVTQARAALALATREHQREADLLARGASTAETVRTLEDHRQIAAAQLEAAAAQLAYTQIVAPFTGVITARQVEPGDLASPGAPLFTVEGSALEVQTAVPESLAAAKLGDAITIELGKSTTAVATITEASPTADPVTRSHLVRLALPAGSSATPGQFVRVRWPDLPATVIRVPSHALTSFGQMRRLFIVADNHAVLRLVTTGHVQDGATVVLSGLNPGETIVLSPHSHLRDGQPLNVTASQ